MTKRQIRVRIAEEMWRQIQDVVDSGYFTTKQSFVEYAIAKELENYNFSALHNCSAEEVEGGEVID